MRPASRHVETGEIVVVYDAAIRNSEILDAIEILKAPGIGADCGKTVCLQNLGHCLLEFGPDGREPYVPKLTILPGETIEIPTDTWQLIWGSPTSARGVDIWMFDGTLKAFPPAPREQTRQHLELDAEPHPQTTRFPMRAEWFRAKKRELGLPNLEIEKRAGPNHETLRKVDRGLPVNESTLTVVVEKFAANRAARNARGMFPQAGGVNGRCVK